MTLASESRDLAITRHLAAPRAAVWRCWSEPDLLRQWYCPKPWQVSHAEMDMRPGGVFNTVFNGPNGEVMPNRGQYLDILAGERLVFTDAFVGNWQPGDGAPFMVGHVNFTDTLEGGTNMVWGARHWTAEATSQHREMGFEAGWNAAADQLDALSQSLRA